MPPAKHIPQAVGLTPSAINNYLDQVMTAARLTPRDSKRVKGELENHLMDLIEAGQAQNLSEEETWKMVQKEFGDPQHLGRQIAHAKGRFLTYVKRETRKLWLTLPLVLVLIFAVKAFALNEYKVANDAVEPYATKGSRVFVNRLASSYHANDLAMYIDSEEPIIGRLKTARGPLKIGIIKAVNENGDVILRRNDRPDLSVKKKALMGGVFLQTR